MPTKKQLQDNYRYMAKSIANYNAQGNRGEKYKIAFWQYATSNNLLPTYDKMGPNLKSEYDKYVLGGRIYGGTVKQEFTNPKPEYDGGPIPQKQVIKTLDNEPLDMYEKLQMNPNRQTVAPAIKKKDQNMLDEGNTPTKPKQTITGVTTNRGTPVPFAGDNKSMGQVLGKEALRIGSALNAIIQAPATIGIAGKKGAEQDGLRGALQGYGKGIADTFKNDGEKAATNSQFIEELAPETTKSLQTKYPNGYKVASTVLDFFGVDDLTAVGILGDITKIQKLNKLPSTTKALEAIVTKAKTNIPLTAEETNLLNTIRKDLGIEPKDGTMSIKKGVEPPSLIDKVRKDLNINPSLNTKLNKPILQSPISKEMPQGNIKPLPPQNNALKTNADVKERGFSQNVQGASDTPENILGTLKNDKLTYEPISNQGTLEKAAKKVDTNPDEALNQFLTGSGKGLTAEDVATGELFIKKAFESGNDTEAYSYISTLAEKLTEAGQAVQAASMFKRMTPEGMLLYAERAVNKANRELAAPASKGGFIDPLKKLYKQGQLTDEMRNSIKANMEEALKLPDGRDKSIKMAAVMQTIADAMPKAPGAKVESFRTIAMLSNPKTWIRNLVGNSAFGVAEAGVTKPIASLIDKGLQKSTGQRSVLNTNFKKLGEGFAEGGKDAWSDFRLGVDTSPTRGMLEVPRSNDFKNIPVLNQLEKTVKLGVSGGDRPFYQAAYKDALDEQLKLYKINTGKEITLPTEEMKNAADEIARYRTYADNNMISDSLSKVKSALNKFRIGGIGAGDVLMKFTRTPANLLARGIDYSPAGLMKGVVDIGRVLAGNTEIQRQAAEGFARGLVGTGFISAAIALSSLGVIRGKRATSANADAFEKATGRGQYTVNKDAFNRLVSSGFNPDAAKPQPNDNLVTYDWLQPLALPAAVGSNVSEAVRKKQKVDAISMIGTVVESLESGINTVIEQPMLQSINRVFKGNNPVEGLMAVMQSYPASFVPAFLQGLRYAADETIRDTSGSATKQVINKIPGLSKNLPASVDVLGNERKVSSKTPIGRLADSALNPAIKTQLKDNPTAEKIMQLYNVSNDGRILPNVVDKKQTIQPPIKGELPKELTSEQKTQYQKLLAEEYMKRAEIIIQSSGTDEEKIKKLVSARIKADDAATLRMRKIIFGR